MYDSVLKGSLGNYQNIDMISVLKMFFFFFHYYSYFHSSMSMVWTHVNIDQHHALFRKYE